jgi:hypothetical protein
MSVPSEMPKSEMLRRSLRCFVLGWWSLVPFLGVIPAALALVDLRAVVNGKGRRWNAARNRLLIGAILAGCGLLLSLILGATLALIVFKAMVDG